MISVTERIVAPKLIDSEISASVNPHMFAISCEEVEGGTKWFSNVIGIDLSWSINALAKIVASKCIEVLSISLACESL